MDFKLCCGARAGEAENILSRRKSFFKTNIYKISTMFKHVSLLYVFYFTALVLPIWIYQKDKMFKF